MSTLLTDLRFALRTLRRNPGFTLAAVLTLALGIGANSAIFSVVNSVLLRPLPYAEPERLVTVWGHYESIGRSVVSLPDFRDYRDGATTFEHMAARHSSGFNLTGDGEPEQLTADRVTSNFFPTLGVVPALGRGFLPHEGELGSDNNVVVLSHGFWQRRYGGDAAVVGRTISLSGTPYTVVGIAPEGFRFWRTVDLWAPVFVGDTAAGRRSEYLTVFGRLKPGVPLEQAQSEMTSIAQRLAQEYPQTNASWTRLDVLTLRDTIVGDARPALLVFMGAVGLVLLIACANVGNLLLARAASREREVAVRTALGAGRGRLVRQLMTESMVIALLGGAAGFLLAVWGVDLLRASGTTIVPRLEELRVDATVIGFSFVVALLTGALFGLAPALRLAFGSLHASLKEGSRGATGGAVVRFRNALVLLEVAVALVLLVGAGLLLRSFDQLNRVDTGIEARGVASYFVVLPSSKYELAQLPGIYEQLAERTAALPGVRAVSLSSGLPMQGAGYYSFSIEGRVPPEDGSVEDVQPLSVDPGYLRTLGLRLQRGRFIEPQDVYGQNDVAVINEEMVRRFYPDRDPIGTRITYGNPENPETRWMTVVGVVSDVKYEGVGSQPYPQVYRSVLQFPSRGLWVSMRTEQSDPLSIAPMAREALRAVDPELPLNDLRTMEARIAENVAQPRVSVALLGVFALVALALAAIGIYGVLSYAVAQRTREIGIRIALGASSTEVERLVVWQGMAPVLLGIAVGIGGALLLTRVMESLLFGVSATDPLTFAGVALFLAAIALVASYLPARRATLVEPVIALRQE